MKLYSNEIFSTIKKMNFIDIFNRMMILYQILVLKFSLDFKDYSFQKFLLFTIQNILKIKRLVCGYIIFNQSKIKR